ELRLVQSGVVAQMVPANLVARSADCLRERLARNIHADQATRLPLEPAAAVALGGIWPGLPAQLGMVREDVERRGARVDRRRALEDVDQVRRAPFLLVVVNDDVVRNAAHDVRVILA